MSGHADRRANLLHEDRLSAEARVFAGVVGEDRDLVLERRARDRLRNARAAVAAALVARDLGNELAVVVEQQDRDAIDLENLIRVADDLLEQRVDVASPCRAPSRPRAASRASAGSCRRADASLRRSAPSATARARCRRSARRDRAPAAAGRSSRRPAAPLPARRRSAAARRSAEAGTPTLPNVTMSPARDRRACSTRVAVDERAVARAEVADDRRRSSSHCDLGVAARDRRIEDRDVARRRAPDDAAARRRAARTTASVGAGQLEAASAGNMSRRDATGATCGDDALRGPARWP